MLGGLEMVRVVLPGDEVIPYDPETSSTHIVLGPGLRWEDRMVSVAKAGLLKKVSRPVLR